ncbi:hypothetical protein [Roseateles sp. BYS96W]|uniref:Uncharacterized protein n=1 Tax=Pelomonas nitida TaxID=3299027 RepID=A0ABW7G611_9BURK
MKHLLASVLLLLSSSLAVAAGAPDDSPEALMREAFTGWLPGRATTITAPGPDGSPQQVSVVPQLVLALDASHRALVVSGVRVLEGGQRIESHSAPANLGVYVFTQRDGRWVASHATPSAGWTGFFGKPGRMHRVELGNGRVGLGVENDECWQGFCGEWLTLFDVTNDGTRQILHLMTGSSSVNAPPECGAWLQGTRPTPPAGHDAKLCFDISGRWQLATAPGRDEADLIVHFEGRDGVVDARSGAARVNKVRETLVLRRQGERYEPLRGRNPTHKI